MFMDDVLVENSHDSAVEQVQFDLFRRQHELKEISGILQTLTAKGQEEQKQWIRENEDIMVELAEEFIDESLHGLDGIQMDNETVRLSVEVMTQLRETLGLFQAIIAGEDELEA